MMMTKIGKTLHLIQVGYVYTGKSPRPGYYVADDKPLTPRKSEAATYLTQEAAEVDAAYIRHTWNLKPVRGRTVTVKVITESV